MEQFVKEQVTAFLQETLGGTIEAVEPIGHGDWSQAFSFQTGGTALVVRFGSHVADFEKDRRAHAFSGPDMPVPRVRKIGEGLGGYYCLAERAYGSFLDAATPEAMQALVPAVCRLFDALRAVDLSATTGYGGWDASGNAVHDSWRSALLSVDQENERVFGWHERLAASPTGSGPYRAALAYLEAHVDRCPETRSLLHNDLLHDNVLVDGDRITAVLDWGNSTYGDFLYEMAAFDFYAPWYPAMRGIDWRRLVRRHLEEQGVALPHFAERLRCYHAHLGLDGMAYSAFTQRWDNLAAVAARTNTLLTAP